MENSTQRRLRQISKELFIETIKQQQFIQTIGTAMDDRMFTVSNIIASLMKNVFDLTNTGKEYTIEEVINDLYRNRDYISPLNCFEYSCNDLGLIGYAIETGVLQNTSIASIQYLNQKRAISEILTELNIVELTAGTMYRIKDIPYVIGASFAHGADYWIHKRADYDNQANLLNLPSYRLSELMPLKASDFKGHMVLNRSNTHQSILVNFNLSDN